MRLTVTTGVLLTGLAVASMGTAAVLIWILLVDPLKLLALIS